MFHDVEAVVDGARVFERKEEPSSQQACAHGCGGAVEHAEQAAPFGRERLYELEVAHGERVHAHVALLLDARNGADVGDARVLRDVEVVQCGSGGYYGVGHAVDAEAFEGGCGELAPQALVGGLECEHPVVQLECEVACGHLLLKAALASAHHEHFLGGHVGEQFVDVGGVAFGREEFAGADVEEGDACGAASEVDGGEEVVLPAEEHVVGGGHAGRDKLGDAALDEFFCELGVFELFADGHALACAYEFREVGVDGVVRKSGHFDVLRHSVGAAGECDAENLRRCDGVFAVCLVEVAHAEQQHGVGMKGFHLEILLHERCFDYFLAHGRCVSRLCLRRRCVAAAWR